MYGVALPDREGASYSPPVTVPDRRIDRQATFVACPAERCSRHLSNTGQESVIGVEHACARLLRKPWGRFDLRPWNNRVPDGAAIGEIWFERGLTGAPDPALLLKLLFTSEPLSIQVHPDDAFARTIGLPHGKTEAWYILSAARDAKVGVGLKQRLTSDQLRTSIEDGSIEDLVLWQPVRTGDVVSIPAGTIHAIGSGLVIAEVQQRSDATFRLFDYGRGRELHIENGVMVARTGPPDDPPASRRLTGSRTLLAACPYFVIERIDLLPESRWELKARDETWLLLLDGDARVGSMDLSAGDVVFMMADRGVIQPGAAGLSGLVAYPGAAPGKDLLQALAGRSANSSVHSMEARP